MANEKAIPLSDSERTALNSSTLFRAGIVPSFLSPIDPHDPNDPIRKQAIPTEAEVASFATMEDARAGDEVRGAQHIQKVLLVHPLATPDRLLVHHGDVSRRPAKSGEAQFEEKRYHFHPSRR